jgi:hypothetical protein
MDNEAFEITQARQLIDKDAANEAAYQCYKQ